MKKYIITPLLLCCLALPAWADSVQLRENHPDRYVVVKGDTLWDISAKFLKDPWLWPKVWRMNREQIKNPHLIYPGDVIVLDLSGLEPQLRLLREEVRLQPGVRVEALEKKPIPTIAPSVIAPFLTQPLVVEQEALDTAPVIVGAQDGRLLLSPDINVYVSKLNAEDGANWQIYRPSGTFVDPDTDEVLGVEAKYMGDATATRFGEPATVRITRFVQDVNIGDKVTPPSDTVLNTYIPHAPEAAIKGRILSTYNNNAEVGRTDVVAISRGSADGVEVGHVLAIYREGGTVPPVPGEAEATRSYISLERNEDGTPKRDENGLVIVRTGTQTLDGEPIPAAQDIQLPEERIGLVMVFRTFERVSYGLIMQSERSVNVMDVVATP